jgi:large conductance mechanosensitive channel
MVESWFVVPVVVGSNPTGHPENKNREDRPAKVSGGPVSLELCSEFGRFSPMLLVLDVCLPNLGATSVVSHRLPKECVKIYTHHMPAKKEKKTGFWTEFRAFAVRGNVIDLAVAVVIGTAFSAIVNTLVSGIITPLLGLVTGGTTDVKNLALPLRPIIAGSNAQPLLLQYGAFIQAIINFFIIAISIFLFFKIVSSARRKLMRDGEDAVPEHEKPAEERLLEEIRDLLKDGK